MPSGVHGIYLFGSARYGEPHPRDIDVLVVYSSGLEREAPSQIAAPIREGLERHLSAPLHVLLLSQEEEDQVGFVQSEDALRVWPPEALSVAIGAHRGPSEGERPGD